MDSRCHQSSFCFIKNDVEAFKVISHVCREVNALENINIVFDGKVLCKMKAWGYRPIIPRLRRQGMNDQKFAARLSYIGRLYLKERRAGDVAQR
jgi:hypothetical protein